MSKIIKRLAPDNTVLYGFDDNASPLVLNPQMMVAPGFRVADVSSSNAEIVTGVTLPVDFTGGSYTYDSGVWAAIIPPYSVPENVPFSIPRWAAHKILKKNGKFGAVNSTISMISDADLKETFQVAFEEHPEFRRVSPFIAYMISEEVFADQAEVDGYFLEAQALINSALFSQE